MTKLSDIIKQAEFAAGKKARLADIHTGDSGHLILIRFTDRSEKYMHAPPGELDMDWEVSQDNLRWQKRMADDIL